MNRLLPLGLVPFAIAAPAVAQPMDQASMPGMKMPTPKAAPPKAKPAPAKPPAPRHEPPATGEDAAGGAPGPAPAADPHAGHTMPAGAPPTAPATSQDATPTHDHSAMPEADAVSAVEIPKSPPPPPPADHVADRYFDPARMAAARATLRLEHGGVQVSQVMANLAEYQARSGGADGYRWEGQAWYGGDINRIVLKTEGEGTRGEGVATGEVRALYSRAVGVYTDVQAGLRQDFKPGGRTYVTVGAQSLLPYWFDVEGALFLSTKGEVLARAEGSYDLRLTNRWILQPRAELNFAAQDTRATRRGSGLSNAELGLRLRYEIRREFAPYVGVSYDRKFGKTADYARASGDGRTDKSLVFGVRAWF